MANNTPRRYVAYWKVIGIYTEAEEAAIEKFKEVFKTENFQFFLLIAFFKDGSIPEAGPAVIKNKALMQAMLYSIMAEHDVSPVAKKSLALRLSEILNKVKDVEAKVQTEQPVTV